MAVSATTLPPRRILMASDLSARSDRALERALSLATEWGAELIIVHAFEGDDIREVALAERAVPSWRRPPDAVAVARQRILKALREDLGAAANRATVLVEEGAPADVIERVAVDERADLIVTGVAREKPFAAQAVILGKTVERLLRRSAVPVLVVTNRARAPYQHIVVATDFSDSSANALQAALRFFPDHRMQLLHAFEAPYAGVIDDPAKYEERYRTTLQAEMDAFLQLHVLSEDQRRRLDALIEPGRPAALVREYVLNRNADLVVLGTHGRGAALTALLGSTAQSILASLPCDALVVREPRATAPG